MFRYTLILTLPVFFLSCTLMDRHPDSGYSGQEDIGEPGYAMNTRTLNQGERDQVESDVEVRRLENSNLHSGDETEQYNHYRATMSPKERAEFLRVKDTSSRKRWLQAREIPQDRGHYSRNIASVVEEGDVVLGMPQDAVKESWGDPELVEVAGNPNYGNERWTYTRYLSSTEGFEREERVIYFEGGRVVGWERH